MGHETNAGCPRPKNKKHVINQPHTIIDKNIWGLPRFARLGASALRAESSGEAFGAWRNDSFLCRSSLTKAKINVIISISSISFIIL
ncbi:MAG: hypothetical protein PHC35_08795 [Deltaproteobacteria bacterium]|nr:hypothetical protein [Deltaproteobacteria bacterium]